jgi:two-component system, NtrC family, sensor histidine kinase HydH
MTEREGFRQGIHATWARSALLATTVALGLALVAASWSNYRGARSAVEPLNRGHVEVFENALRQTFGLMGPADDSETLADVLALQEEAGLRYVAFLEVDGTVVSSAGEAGGPVVVPSGLFDRARTTGIVMIPVNDRIRAFLPRPIRGGGGSAGRRLGGGPGGFPIGLIVLEFEPVAANQLIAQAGRSLALGSIAAGLLTLAALLFWRKSARYEVIRRDLEQQRRLTQLGEMSAVLAHEIRNPLASLKGNAQLLAERLPAGTRDRRRADRVVGEATRLEALTADLLDFARSGPINRENVDPVGLVRLAAEEAGVRSLPIMTAAPPRRWSLDTIRIRQALVNLIRNAVEVSPPDDPPEILVAEEDDGLVFQVRDHGPGIPPEERARIFEPFYTTRTNGTGLGLSVARRVVELHGGTLTAENAPEGGALFRIVLPASGAVANGAPADR